MGEKLRESAATGRLSPQDELQYFLNDRRQHVEEKIAPSLAGGKVVILDRYYFSTMAYQGDGQGADKDLIRAQIGLLGVKPDVTLVLDVSAVVRSVRLRQRGGDSDRYEREDAAFHARVNAGFQAIAQAEPDRCRVVSADGTEQEVHAAILAAIGL